MKKIQVLFAAVAIAAASVGVFAKPFVTYYVEDAAGDRDCDTIYTGAICSGGTNQCSVSTAQGTKYVTFINAQNQCVALLTKQ